MTESEPAYFKRNTAELSAADLQEYQALAYEIEMLVEVAKLIAGQPNAQAFQNVLIESFATHFRNLAFFLWRPPKKATDVVAATFAASWEAAIREPTELIDRVSREIAHLTTHRLSGMHTLKAWNPVHCIHALLPTLESFVVQADPSKLSPKVSEEVGRLRSLLDSPMRFILETTNLTTSTTHRLGVLE